MTPVIGKKPNQQRTAQHAYGDCLLLYGLRKTIYINSYSETEHGPLFRQPLPPDP